MRARGIDGHEACFAEESACLDALAEGEEARRLPRVGRVLEDCGRIADGWVTPGGVPDRAPDSVAFVDTGDGERESPVWTTTRHESDTVEVVIPIERPLGADARLTVPAHGRVHRIRGDEIVRP